MRADERHVGMDVADKALPRLAELRELGVKVTAVQLPAGGARR